MKSKLNAFVVAERELCISCRVCELACFGAHNEGGAPLTMGNITSPIQSRIYLVQDELGGAPVQCRHCEDAPCAESCPLGAISEQDGRIQIDSSHCVICKNCVLSCPFGAIELVEIKNTLPIKDDNEVPLIVANKCDRCFHLDSPACVDNCPQNALRLIEPNSYRQEKLIATAESLAALFV